MMLLLHCSNFTKEKITGDKIMWAKWIWNVFRNLKILLHYKSLDVIGYGRVIFKNSSTHRIKNNTFDLEKVGRNKMREQNSLTP